MPNPTASLHTSCPNANLSGADLSGVDLSYANLSNAILSGATLTGTNLTSATLIGTNLPNATLTSANLSGANLSTSYLAYADLTGANLTGANLYRAFLNGANLTGANLDAANLDSANLTGASAGGVFLVPIDETTTAAVGGGPAAASWPLPSLTGATDACTPASGSVFPVGATTVTCTITPTHGGVASGGTFTMTVGLPPANTVAPSLTGSGVVGQVLTCSAGTWSGYPTPTYQYTFLRGSTVVRTARALPTYTVTTADQGADITCVVTANNAVGAVDATSSGVSIPAADTPAPALSVAKSADPATVTAAGQIVTYSFKVTNTGNVGLTDVAVSDSHFTGTGKLGAITCPTPSLAPGLAETCTAGYTVTEADVDAGIITNSATATGTAPGDTTLTSSSSTIEVSVTQAPAITMVKSASPTDPASYTAGQTVTYSFVVTNTGNVTLTDAAVFESSFTGTGTISLLSCPGGGPTVATLAPGADVTCTATYVLTQADVAAGKVTNIAMARGNPPEDIDQVFSPLSTVTVPTPPTPAITVVKSASPGTVSKAGQKVTYSFKVTNTGNVTLTDIAVSDSHFTGTGKLGAITCPAGGSTAAALAPGASETCTAGYTTTQADVDAGSITNSATATGTPPGDTPPPTSPPSTATVTSTATGKLVLVKTAHAVDVNGDGVTDAGDRVDWTLVVSNVGTATVTHIHISDPNAGEATCPASKLAPGQSMNCTVAPHTITTADAVRGTVANIAIATGQGVDGTSVSSDPAHASLDVHSPPVTTSSSGGLASTGEDVQLFGVLAGLLLGSGALLMLAGVRRRRTD